MRRTLVLWAMLLMLLFQAGCSFHDALFSVLGDHYTAADPQFKREHYDRQVAKTESQFEPSSRLTEHYVPWNE